MGSESLAIICIFVVISMLVTGIILVKEGNKVREGSTRNVAFICAGWIILGILSLALTIGTVYLFSISSFMTIILVFSMPVIILISLIVTLSYGISCLVDGYSKNKEGHCNTSKIRTGWICLGINTTIITLIIAAIGVLLFLFNTGYFRISLM